MKKTMLEIEIHENEPTEFSPQVHVAACYLEIGSKILLLQRAAGKSEAGRWGVPAGKLEKDETPIDAAARELFEETGICINLSTQLRSLGPLYVRKPETEYIYHLFAVQVDSLPAIRLSPEHQNYTWASLEDLRKLPLMTGAQQALQYYRNRLRKIRTGASVNSYLILKKEDRILFHLRKNTGYSDGMWSFIAGHVEDGESATSAMIREAKEEIGISLLPSQLKVVHIMHRKTNRFNIDIFFECFSWEGAIQNLEPQKCEKLEFFSPHSLPKNLVAHNKMVLEQLLKQEFYSEGGWNEEGNSQLKQ